MPFFDDPQSRTAVARAELFAVPALAQNLYRLHAGFFRGLPA